MNPLRCPFLDSNQRSLAESDLLLSEQFLGGLSVLILHLQTWPSLSTLISHFAQENQLITNITTPGKNRSNQQVSEGRDSLPCSSYFPSI